MDLLLIFILNIIEMKNDCKKDTKKRQQIITKRFGGRRGMTRGTLYRYFESSAPVLTFANPRPTAKPPGVNCKRQTVQWDNTNILKK